MEASAILEAYNFVLLKQFVAHTAEEAKNAAQKIGKKSVMKIVSKDILHKSDVGGVILNITPDNAQEKFIDMMRTVKSRAPQANIDGVLLVEMADNTGSEIILGSNKDPNMGQMIMVGLGGIYVEIFKDVSFGLAPITVNDTERMINNLKSKKILEGARGQKPLDTEALIDCLGRLSQLLTDFPEIKELDINPLLILPKNQGVRVLDARIVLE